MYVSDEGENRSAFVHVSTMGTTVTPVLNGRQEMTLGMMGSVPLENVPSGKNELVIKYEGNPAEAKELRYAIVTPEWVKFNVRKITDRSEKSETFTFSAPSPRIARSAACHGPLSRAAGSLVAGSVTPQRRVVLAGC